MDKQKDRETERERNRDRGRETETETNRQERGHAKTLAEKNLHKTGKAKEVRRGGEKVRERGQCLLTRSQIRQHKSVIERARAVSKREGIHPCTEPGAGIMEADDRQVTTVFTVQPSFYHSALDKSGIMKRYHRRRTCSHTSPRRSPTMVKLHDTTPARSPTMVALHDTRFVECRWLDCENCRYLKVVGLHDTGPRP